MRSQIKPHPVQRIAEWEGRRVRLAIDRAAVVDADVESLGYREQAGDGSVDRSVARPDAVDEKSARARR